VNFDSAPRRCRQRRPHQARRRWLWRGHGYDTTESEAVLKETHDGGSATFEVEILDCDIVRDT